MHFNKMTSIKLTSMLFIITSMALIQADKSAIYSDNVIKFEINPLVCIVEKMGEQCHLNANLNWQTNQLMSVCLVQKNTVIQCWEEEIEIEEKLALYLTESTQLTMTDKSNNKMASITIAVNAIEPKKRRRRLRSAWGVF